MSALAGKRILVTRPRAQAAGLCERLAALGADPILFPTIEIGPAADDGPLDSALRQLAHYHWLIVTSVNGVQAVWRRLAALGRAGQPLPGQLRVAAIGPATAAALEQHGVRPALIPDEYVAEAILAQIGEVAGLQILLPRADLARELLAEALARRGAVVHEITAYRTVPAAPDPAGLAALRRGVDAVTFTSSSTVRNFVALAGRDLGAARVACIGPVTAETARELGLPVHVIAREYTTAGLAAALVDYFARPVPA